MSDRTDPEQAQITDSGRCWRGGFRSGIAQRLGLPTMRVAAIKPHVTMGTYGRHGVDAESLEVPPAGRELPARVVQ